MTIKKVLKEVSYDYLIQFLPDWQKLYFQIDSFIQDKEQLINYIISSNCITGTTTELSFLLLHLPYNQYSEFLHFIEYNGELTALINMLQLNRVEDNILKKIKLYFSISEDIEVFDDREKLKQFTGSEFRFYELLDYQVYVKEQLLTMFTNNKNENRVIVHMPTGTGKTKTSMHTIVMHYLNNMKKKGLVIWIAHTNTLLEQAEETFQQVWSKLGEGKIEVFRLFDKYNDDLFDNSDGIVFLGVQKMISVTKTNSKITRIILERGNLVFFDEAHKSTAYSTKQALTKILTTNSKKNNKILVGLTATPGRNSANDFDNLELVDYYSQNMISINPLIIEQLRHNQFKALNQQLSHYSTIKYFQERGVLAKLKRFSLDYDDSKIDLKIREFKKSNDNIDLNPEILQIFGRNVNRNIAIIDKLEQLHNEARQIIVFACSVEHGKFLTSILQAKGINAGEVYGETTSKKRWTVINKFRNGEISILINCGVLTTGFDSTNINCVFIARPTRSIVLYSQMIGRGLRGPKMGGNEECYLIDVKDNLDKFNNDDEIFKYFNEYWR